jgi:hypothetical protein
MITSPHLYSSFSYCNCCISFLGLEEITKVHHIGSHAMDANSVLQRHQLNATMRTKLKDYFRPFNLLLEQFLEEPLGYSSNNS